MNNELFNIVDIFSRSIMVGVAASITVGPVAVLCIQRTLSKSHRSGLISGLGVASADTLMALVAFFFYSVLQEPIEKYNIILRIVGGLFVVGVGAFIFFQNPVVQIRQNRAGKSSSWQDFVSIFGITLANFLMVIPYILAFFAVFKISTGEASDTSNMMSGVIVTSGFFAGAVGWWTLLSFVINLFRSKFRPRHMLTINHVAGLIIGLLGVYTILSTFLNLIPNNGTI
ncbi:MAG: LysE family transporter [Rikenellaceae bacterium]